MGARRLIVFLAVVAAGLVVFRACRGDPGTLVGVTPELIGTWTTDSQAYAGRFIEIRSGEIVFGLGEEGEARHPILGVRVHPGPEGRSAFVVSYLIDPAGDAEGQLELLVGPADLHIASQPGIRWTVER